MRAVVFFPAVRGRIMAVVMEPNPYEPPQGPIERLEVADDTPPRKWYSLTLVEILVVIALVGLMIALILPAVDSPHRRRPEPSTDVEPAATPDAPRRDVSP